MIPWHCSIQSDLGRHWPQGHAATSEYQPCHLQNQSTDLGGRKETACRVEDGEALFTVQELCCSSRASQEEGRNCIWTGNQALLQEVRERPKHNSHVYSPGLVIVRRSSCRCCCERKHIVRALISARARVGLSRSGWTCKWDVQTHRAWCIAENMVLIILQRGLATQTQREWTFCLSSGGQR